MYIPTTVLTNTGGGSGVETPELDAYVAEVLSDSPVGFWKMDELRGLPQDSSGNSRHMTATVLTDREYRIHGPMPGSYGIRQALGTYFTRAVFSTVTDNFSMEMWFACEIASNQYVFYHGDPASDGWGMDVFDNPPFHRGRYGGVAFLAQGAANIDLGWHHLVLVRDGGVTKEYFDGAVDNAAAGNDVPNTPTANLIIGSPDVAASYALLAIYETVLSPTQVADHYAAAGF